MSLDLAHIQDWVFDLDNTLYPMGAGLVADVEARMRAHLMETLALDGDAAVELRDRYFHQYGATVTGLALHHDEALAHDFLSYTHDLDTAHLGPDEELNALIARLPGRRIVFTNSGAGYPQRVLTQLGLADHVHLVCDIQTAGLAAKPQRSAYDVLVAQCGLDPRRAVFVEDTLRNLEPAHEMGFTTVLVGAVHPDPRPAYVDHWAPDAKAFLREILD